MKAGHARQAGFTLLEVLVALAILSIAVVASIQAFAQGLRLLKLSGDHQQAMLLADQKIREIIDPVEGQEHGTEGPFRWERTTKALEAPDLAPPGSVLRGRLYEVDVRVNWDPRREIAIRTLRLAGAVSGTGAVITGTPATGTPTTGTPTLANPVTGSSSGPARR